MNANRRPRRGLSPDDALKHWSDPAEYAAMKELEDHPRARHQWGGEPAIAARRAELRKRCEELERKLQQKLLDAVVIASGVRKHTLHREAIDPSLWDVLEVDYELEDINGDGVIFEHPEFFEPNAIPVNIRDIPNWLAELTAGTTPRFQASPDYRHVSLGDHSFTLGPLQAKVVGLLHEAAQTDNPWRSGKQLLGQAGSEQQKLGSLFKKVKDWRKLIDVDDRGAYSLKLP